MSEVAAPTIHELREFWREEYDGDPLFEQVHEEADPSWRHGCYMHTTFKRLLDETFWEVSYQVAGDGEYNTLRDDPSCCVITRVFRKEVVKTIYVSRELL